MCLLIFLKAQMLKVSRMTVNWMPLQPLLQLSINPTTHNSSLSHIAPCMQEVARLDPAPLYPKSL